MLGNDNQSDTDSEGRVAIAGNAVLTDYGVGAAISVSTTRPDLVVGGTLNAENGENFSGNTVVSSAQNVIRYTMTNGNGVPDQPLEGRPVDFDAAAEYLHCASQAWAALPPSGTAAVQYGGLTLTGMDPALNIFSIDGTDIAGSGIPLSGLNQININVPSGATTLINVSGRSLGFGSYSIFRNGTAATGDDGRYILWNLPEATQLGPNTTSIKGSLLAPNATYNSDYSNIEGTLVVNNLTGHVEAHNYPFQGTLPNPDCDGSGEGGNEGDCPYRQAINDILESVALEETALSHILNAEGEKIQKALTMDMDVADLLKINESVRKTVNAVSRLENMLLAKMESASGFCSE